MYSVLEIVISQYGNIEVNKAGDSETINTLHGIDIYHRTTVKVQFSKIHAFSVYFQNRGDVKELNCIVIHEL